MFLGQVESARVGEIAVGLSEVATRHHAYSTTINGAGGYVDDRPNARRGGVAWLTLHLGLDETAELALDVDAAIGAHSYDERRRPRPHLTVARAVDASVLAALRDFAPGLQIEFRTSSLVLFRSHLGGAGGSRYEAVATSELA